MVENTESPLIRAALLRQRSVQLRRELHEHQAETWRLLSLSRRWERLRPSPPPIPVDVPPIEVPNDVSRENANSVELRRRNWREQSAQARERMRARRLTLHAVTHRTAEAVHNSYEITRRLIDQLTHQQDDEADSSDSD